MKGLAGFGPIVLFLALFCGLSVLIFGLSLRDPSLPETLALSPDHPTGILTSLFAHHGLSHLASNLLSLLVLSLFFVVLHLPRDQLERRSLSRLFVGVGLASGLSAGSFQFLLWRWTGEETCAVGSSGMVYGISGLLLTSALLSLPRYLHQFRSSLLDPYGSAPSIFVALPLSLYLAALFTFLPLLEAKLFFNITEGVVWTAHKVGFLAGLLLPLFPLLRLRRSGGGLPRG
ncbi:MAG: hypothetical protein DSO04_04700 [Hadesarchaea archaeon]|nr:MAG: hypothetical protein DSO04_04700 [Hadesarchaea archaeon]